MACLEIPVGLVPYGFREAAELFFLLLVVGSSPESKGLIDIPRSVLHAYQSPVQSVTVEIIVLVLIVQVISPGIVDTAGISCLVQKRRTIIGLGELQGTCRI